LMKTVWPKALKAAKTWLGRHVTLFNARGYDSTEPAKIADLLCNAPFICCDAPQILLYLDASVSC
jgi:hypothetical protein